MKSKKGLSNIEMVVSFIIFIAFVSFLLIVFNPLKKFTTTDVFLESTERQILNNITDQLELVTLKIEESTYSPSAICYCIESSSVLPEIYGIVVKTDTGVTVASRTGSDKICFENIGKFYKIYNGNGLESDYLSESCQNLNFGGGDYTLGVRRTYSVVSSEKMEILKTAYETDYSGLKEDLELENDFALILYDRVNNVEMFRLDRDKPEGIQVLAKEIPLGFLNSDANINSTVLNIQVY